MAIRTVTGFLGALAAIVLVLAVVAVVQTRIEQRPDIELDGQWRLAHTIEKGPYKTWTFEYDLTLSERDGGFVGHGETVAVNGRPPKPHEQTTLDIVRGMVEGRSLIAWFFERNGERAGRGAIKWQVLDADRLVGTYATTFSAGASVALRPSAAPSQPAVGLR
jgi:hypothetical protein